MALLIGSLIEALVGEPNNPFHPVRGIGWIANKIKKIFFYFKLKGRVSGVVATSFLLILTYGLTFFVVKAANEYSFWLGLAINSLIIYFCLSPRGLIEASSHVLTALKEDGLEGGRLVLSQYVSRDTDKLDVQGVYRGTLETISENICDGVIAPIFFILLGGPALGMTYKCLNTLDSMWGYRIGAYKTFGWFSARLDDLANFIPARIGGVLIIFTALVLRYDWKRSFRVFMRDRKKHDSPNSAHCESAIAGALGIQLGGPSLYKGSLKNRPLIGDCIYTLGPQTLLKANRMIALIFLIAVILGFLSKGGFNGNF